MPRFKLTTRETVHGEYYVEAADAQAARDLFERGSVQPPKVFESLDTTIENVEEVADELAESPKYRHHLRVKVKGDETLYEVLHHARHKTEGWQYVLVRLGQPLSTGAHPRNPINEDQIEEA